MKSKSMMLLVVAAGCGLVAMFGVQQVLARSRNSVPMARALVARGEVGPGVKLTEELVEFREIPAATVPEDAITTKEEFDDRALKSRAFPGQVLVKAQLGQKGVFGTSVRIPPGKRLTSVPVNATQIHSGIMKPGDRVDLVLTYEVQNRTMGREKRTKTILEYIQVFAMGDHQIGSEPVEDKKAPVGKVENVTLLVTQPQAELIQFAMSLGTIHPTLRGVQDQEPVESSGTDESKLDALRAELNTDLLEARGVAEHKPAHETKEPEPQPVQHSEPATQSFADFVKGPVATTNPETPPPPRPTWKIEIFDGQQRRVEEIPLPEGTTETQVRTTSTTGETAPMSWSSLKTMFSKPKTPTATTSSSR